MLGYGRGSVVRANEHGLDAKIVRPATLSKSALMCRTLIANSKEHVKISFLYAL
jgi:hypothetical protein